MLITIWIATVLALMVSYQKDKSRTLKALARSIDSIKGLSSGLLGLISIVGMILAVIPQETMVRVFDLHGVVGFVVVSLIGAVVTIPGPIAFPLAGSLLKMGANPAALASFITTLTMVGLVSAPMEASYFGRRFTIIRQVSSFLAAIAIGLIMGVFL